MNLIVVLVICGLSFVSGFEIDGNKAYCYKYRWLPPFTPEDRWNCSDFEGVPCVEPLIENSTDFNPPNAEEYWWSNDTEKMCVLTPENVCVTYSFLYNDAVVNVSKYCGKVTQDKTAVTSGCFTHHKDGHDVRVCACQSAKGSPPCNNSSSKLKYSIIAVLILPLMSSVTLRRLWSMRIT